MGEVQPQFLGDHQIVELRYYGIRVFSSLFDRQKLDSNKSLGRLILFLGLCLIIISGVDISAISGTLTQSEQSIWPSSGKGIWIGLFLVCVGVFTLIAVKEESHSSFYILLPYTIVGIILCFFGLLTSISVLQRYTTDPILSQTENRTKEQGIQFALSGLLIGIFGLAFLFLSCLSCLVCWTIPNFCAKYQGPNPQRFYSSSQHALLQTPPSRIVRSYRRPIIGQFPRNRYSLPYRPNRVYRK